MLFFVFCVVLLIVIVFVDDVDEGSYVIVVFCFFDVDSFIVVECFMVVCFLWWYIDL